MISRKHLRDMRADIVGPLVAAFAAYALIFNARWLFGLLRDAAGWLQ
jgi:FPC/CPF motif-containing protein YcgG